MGRWGTSGRGTSRPWTSCAAETEKKAEEKIRKEGKGQEVSSSYAFAAYTSVAVFAVAREMFTFCVFPNINPDGSISGYLRTDADDQNLNREWYSYSAPPSMGGGDGAGYGAGATYNAPMSRRSAEVLRLLRAMDRGGCDTFLDFHDNEALPFNFLAGSEGMPVWGRRLEALHGGERSSFSSLDSRFSS